MNIFKRYEEYVKRQDEEISRMLDEILCSVFQTAELISNKDLDGIFKTAIINAGEITWTWQMETIKFEAISVKNSDFGEKMVKFQKYFEETFGVNYQVINNLGYLNVAEKTVEVWLELENFDESPFDFVSSVLQKHYPDEIHFDEPYIIICHKIKN